MAGGYRRLDRKGNDSCSTILLYLICIGLIVWLLLLSLINFHPPANSPLNPVINTVEFLPTPTYQARITIDQSIGSEDRYQYIGVIRNGIQMIDSIDTNAHAMPKFSKSRLSVLMPVNFAFERGDVIVHQYYSSSDIMFASLLAQATKVYQNQCLVNVKNTSIPFCWNRQTQIYCQTPRLGITGPVLTNVPQYFNNHSNQLTLDPTNGCYFGLLEFEQTFRILFPDIIVMPNNFSDCFIFSRTTNDARFYLPSVFFDVFLNIPADPVMAGVSAFIYFGNPDDAEVFVKNPTQIFTYSWKEDVYNNQITNITICGYVQALSTYSYVPRISNPLTLGAINIYQWGNLGLEQLSLYHDYGTLQYITPSDTQPSIDTLKAIPQLIRSDPGINNVLTWNMSRIENFYGAFSQYDMSVYPLLDAIDTRSGKNFSYMFSGAYFGVNQTLANFNMLKAENLNSMFDGAYGEGLNVSGWRFGAYQVSFHATFANFYVNPNIIDVSKWNPNLVINLDYFATGSYVYPNITSWKLRRDICANDMLNFNYAVDTLLYDALLIKFANQTDSLGCTWQYTQVPRSNVSDTAYATLCGRGWHISDTVDACN